MAKLKPYGEYRETGLLWLDKAPKHWSEIRIKDLIDNVASGIWGNEPITGSLENFTCIRVADFNMSTFSVKSSNLTLRNISIPNSDKRWLKKGDLLIEKSGGGEKQPVGRVIIYQEFGRAVCSNFISKISFNKTKANSKFILYVLNMLQLRKDVLPYIKQTTGIQNLDEKAYFSQFIILPPKGEQDQIARFLDNKLFKINKFIKAKKRQIVLLKELKQAIINQAVTKGINLNVPMKDSGVEWIGEIPEHWDVRKLSNIAVIILSGLDKKSYDGQRQVKLCNYIDVYSNHYITNDINFMTATAKENEIMKFSLFKGDIIITKDSESWDDIAVPAYVSEDLENVLCGYHLAIIRVNTLDVYKQFLFKSFLSNYVAYQFNIKAKGVTRYGISYQHIHDTMIVIPPFREQKEIVSFIINQTQTIDKAIETIQKQIDLVKEYRTTLISEVVTGKVDVRHIPVEDTDEFIEDIDGEDEGIFVEKFTEEV
ncbi:MAG TPA: restriction endonuclease subunit S [Clostridiaceae bacterium]|jgi:type I restriction enzyme S subunit|nr:restriction endonuclease subunit S [Clostridiaceae bacterium]